MQDSSSLGPTAGQEGSSLNYPKSDPMAIEKSSGSSSPELSTSSPPRPTTLFSRSQPLIFHQALLAFKDPKNSDTVSDTLLALQKNSALKILNMKFKRIQNDRSEADFADGYTHSLQVGFRNEADRKIYLEHPAHKEAVALVSPYLAKFMVVDTTVTPPVSPREDKLTPSTSPTRRPADEAAELGTSPLALFFGSDSSK